MADTNSMTGCGKGIGINGVWETTVELRSVNHRFLDIGLRLPRNLTFLEETIRKALSGAIRRGHVDVYLQVKNTEDACAALTVHERLAREYMDAARRVAASLHLENTLTVRDLLQMDGVVEAEETAMDEEAVADSCRQAMEQALAQLTEMRRREGAHLREDLAVHLACAAELRERILQRAPSVVEEYRARLKARLDRLPIEPVDPARLAQEVALMADRCAIDEELSRLDSHLKQQRLYLDQKGEIGKKMDFLIQEMNREANTIGSKASDAEIARYVVDLKSEIEKLREQIQNVE